MKVVLNDYIEKFSNDSDLIDYCLSLFVDGEENSLIFSHKTWVIDRAVLLPSNTTVIIDNCTIKQKDGTFDNIFRGNNLVFADDECFPVEIKPLRNVKILGKGQAVLEGPDVNRKIFHPILNEEQDMVGDFYGFRTHQISFTMISGCEISGLSIVKTRGWAMCFDVSNDIHISNVHFDTNVKNGDGIDFRSGTHHCVVENVTGKTSDDSMACTALARTEKLDKNSFPIGNALYPSEPSCCVLDNRTEEERNIHDVVIRNIDTCGKYHAIICLAAKGCKIYNIRIEGVHEPKGEWRDATVRIYTGYGGGYTKGDLHDIHVKDVYATYADNAVYCNTEVENLVLENIQHEKENQKIKLDFPEGVQIL